MTKESKLRKLRLKHGVTLQELGDYVGVTAATIQRMEIGEVAVKPQRALRFIRFWKRKGETITLEQVLF